MKAYELGEEVFAVVKKPVTNKEMGLGGDLSMDVPHVMKTSIKNRTEHENNPANFVYEVEGYEGSVKAKFIFADEAAAKQNALDNTKEGPVKEYLKKKFK